MEHVARSLNNHWDRFGETLEYYIKVDVGTDEFNNREWDWRYQGTTLALVSFENAMEEVNEITGEYDTDEPVFYFRYGDGPVTLRNDDQRMEGSGPVRVKRIEKDDRWYELQAPTRRDGHVQIKGELVRDSPPVEKYPEEDED